MERVRPRGRDPRPQEEGELPAAGRAAPGSRLSARALQLAPAEERRLLHRGEGRQCGASARVTHRSAQTQDCSRLSAGGRQHGGFWELLALDRLTLTLHRHGSCSCFYSGRRHTAWLS